MIAALWTAVALAGMVVPGYLLARHLWARDGLLAGFVVSLVLLFHVIFWLGMAGLRLGAGTVGAGLAALSVVFLIKPSSRRQVVFPPPLSACPDVNRTLRRAALLVAGISITLMFVRTCMMPLSGLDTPFRWARLAREILATGSLDYYPPTTPGNYRHYFYPEGFPPMVSMSYWWLWTGLPAPRLGLTSLLITAQYALTLAAAARLAGLLGGGTAASWTLLLVPSSGVVWWSYSIGQEGGLLTLSLIVTLLFLAEATRTDDGRGPVTLAALAASLGALSRDYGPVIIFCGAVAAIGFGVRRRLIALFLATSTLVAAPWYLRCWLLTGHPFYAVPLGSLFPVPPIWRGIIETYGRYVGWQAIGVRGAFEAFAILAAFSTASLLLLAPALMESKRRLPVAASAAIMTVIWLSSVKYTAGALGYSIRVLTPVLVIIGLLAGCWLAARRRLPRWLVAAAVVAALYGVAAGWTAPAYPWGLTWRSFLNPPRPFPSPTEEERGDVVRLLAERPGRMLTEGYYLDAWLHGSGIECVPVWSPEVEFIFQPGSADEDLRRLSEMDIRWWAVDPSSLDWEFLKTASPFLRQELASGVPIFSWRKFVFFHLG